MARLVEVQRVQVVTMLLQGQGQQQAARILVCILELLNVLSTFSKRRGRSMTDHEMDARASRRHVRIDL